ncbi:hypothetical protein BDP27DRAFT_861633 [Rhodocollybia butyracea]|uniref:F-box domain-containing protein n=1 Tax=Rhodocollybia butyracea TaxID=206335 RepID=A0A9P5PTJ3_9AGAR|nr:hypothetical protein BDP27DRAFT_861633 [Rhodocollybia butyracea]
MTILTDLPEELLCLICEKTEPSTLPSLVTSCKLLNRIAGSQYLLFISRDPQDPFILVADQETSGYMSFETLRNIMSITGSASSVKHVWFRFSSSAAKTLQQLRLATLLLQKIHHPLYSLKFNFSKAENDITFSPLYNTFPSFNCAFGRLLWEAYRLRCRSLSLAGVIPFAQDCFRFRPIINTSVSYFTVDDAFLLSQAQRGWLIEFLNASKEISFLLAHGSEGWTHVLPKLRMPALAGIAFFGQLNLCRIDCGPYQFKTSLTSKLGCQYPLSQLQVLRASISQLLA